MLVDGCAAPLVVLPGQIPLLGRLDGAVAQPLGVAARHDELHGRVERLDELFLLVVEILADALGDRDGGALEFQHADRDAVQVEHDIRALAVLAADRDLFSKSEVVDLRVGPVDEVDRLGQLAHVRLDLDPVAQQPVHRLVGVVEGLGLNLGRLLHLAQCPTDQRLRNALTGQEGPEQAHLDVAVACPLLPVAQVAVAEFLLEELDHPLLGLLLHLADGAHAWTPIPIGLSLKLIWYV